MLCDDGFHFMDGQSYEQFTLSDDDLAGSGGYLKEGLGGIRSVLFNGDVISVEVVGARGYDLTARPASAESSATLADRHSRRPVVVRN